MRTTAHLTLLAMLIMAALPVSAESLRATVVNNKGEAVSQAVVYARPVGGYRGDAAPEPAVVDQVNKEFVPDLTVVYQGARVAFPNNDNIRHHVYSFSKSNAFEIPLYADQHSESIVFENPGEVALGCNVHDWMSAHVYVTDTPWFAVTNTQGEAELAGLPAGEYEVEVWHAQLRGKPEKLRQQVTLTPAGADVEFSIRQKKVWKAWRESGSFGEGY